MRRRLFPLLLICGLCQAEPAPLRFAVMDSWTMPLARFEDNEFNGGILYELMQQLARQVGRSAEFKIMPRLRAELSQEQQGFDVRCYVSPAWNHGGGNDYAWSVDIMHQRDVLVVRRGERDELPLDEPQPISIGTVTGYSYPTLQKYFDQGLLIRDDARSQELVLQKLLAKRYDYAISSQLALEWFNRLYATSGRLEAIQTLSEETLGCLVRKGEGTPTQEILQALRDMKETGEIERIVARHR